MNIEIEFESDGVYISIDGAYTCFYDADTKEELRLAICDYIDTTRKIDEVYST